MSLTCIGPRHRCSPTTPAMDAIYSPAICWAAAPFPAKRSLLAGACWNSHGAGRNQSSFPMASAAPFSKTVMKLSCEASASAPASGASVSANAAAKCFPPCRLKLEFRNSLRSHMRYCRFTLNGSPQYGLVESVAGHDEITRLLLRAPEEDGSIEDVPSKPM